jgi:hypothetical protein
LPALPALTISPRIKDDEANDRVLDARSLAKALPREVESGSWQENGSNQDSGARLNSIETGERR